MGRAFNLLIHFVGLDDGALCFAISTVSVCPPKWKSFCLIGLNSTTFGTQKRSPPHPEGTTGDTH